MAAGYACGHELTPSLVANLFGHAEASFPSAATRRGCSSIKGKLLGSASGIATLPRVLPARIERFHQTQVDSGDSVCLSSPGLPPIEPLRLRKGADKFPPA